MKNLIKAVLAVMEECRTIDKNITVGEGRFAYKGVSDKDVKLLIGQSMHRHGLVILPIGIERQQQIDSYIDEYGKTKFRVQTSVNTKYLLAHESGESIELVGAGDGVDTQDKAIGKATTYALKYTLLYTFLVATGAIDDTDTTHSNNLPTPDIFEKIKKLLSEAGTTEELNNIFRTLPNNLKTNNDIIRLFSDKKKSL